MTRPQFSLQRRSSDAPTGMFVYPSRMHPSFKRNERLVPGVRRLDLVPEHILEKHEPVVRYDACQQPSGKHGRAIGSHTGSVELVSPSEHTESCGREGPVRGGVLATRRARQTQGYGANKNEESVRVKIGLSLGISHREPISHTVEIVQRAEELGFDSVWLADVQLSMKDCFSALILCAANTSTIELATGVTNPVTRHPTTIANAFSALQEVSGGRALIGIGTGWTAVFSIGLKPATVKQLEEAIVAIRKLCSGEEVAGGEGARYRLVTAQGALPIYVAANQPRMLRMAGRVADGVILMGGANTEFTSWQIGHVRRGAEEAGRRLEDIKLHLWAAIAVSDDRQQAIADVRHWVASQAETFSQWRELPEFLRPFEQDFERAAKAYDRLEHMSRHASHREVVSPELVSYLALVGSSDECLERIRKLETLGLDGVTLAVRAGGRLERMQALHEGIIKHLKEPRVQQ